MQNLLHRRRYSSCSGSCKYGDTGRGICQHHRTFRKWKKNHFKTNCTFLGYSKSGVIHLTENIKEKVYQNFKTIIELNNSNTENAHSICSRLLYTVLFDIASCIEGNPNNDKANLIKPCIDYIKSNYMHDISISALAEMIKVTPTYLGIIFKKVYNITPQKFLTNIRIENSKQLLVSNKNMSLSDVAINSGFNSESYFCNTFKKYIGITPTEYRSINTFGEI